MIKKLLFTLAATLSLGSAATAQSSRLQSVEAPPIAGRQILDFTPAGVVSAKTTSATVGDTMWYFYNKHILRNPNNTLFNAALSPQASTLDVTQFASVFLNTSSITVTGLECIAARKATSTGTAVTIRMYLGNVSASAPYILSLPLIDSLDVVATGTNGGFRGANFSTAKTVGGNFAVLFRCVSPVPGDSALLYMNNGKASGTTPASQAYGEGLAFYRIGNQIYQNTGAWGTGTDREYCVAPRVQYTVNTAMATNTAAICNYTPSTFNNTSNFRVSHRQYNLNEFYRRWKPFANTTYSISADSVFEWNFGDNTPLRYTTSSVPSISKTYTAAGMYTVTLTSNLRKSGNWTDPSDLTESATAVKTINSCDVGINEQPGFENLKVYPNPLTGGKTTVSGLTGSSTIYVFNLLGQPVTTLTTDREAVQIDLQAQPEGSYFIKIISNTSNATRVVKVVNHN